MVIWLYAVDLCCHCRLPKSSNVRHRGEETLARATSAGRAPNLADVRTKTVHGSHSVPRVGLVGSPSSQTAPATASPSPKMATNLHSNPLSVGLMKMRSTVVDHRGKTMMRKRIPTPSLGNLARSDRRVSVLGLNGTMGSTHFRQSSRLFSTTIPIPFQILRTYLKRFLMIFHLTMLFFVLSLVYTLNGHSLEDLDLSRIPLSQGMIREAISPLLIKNPLIDVKNPLPRAIDVKNPLPRAIRRKPPASPVVHLPPTANPRNPPTRPVNLAPVIVMRRPMRRNPVRLDLTAVNQRRIGTRIPKRICMTGVSQYSGPHVRGDEQMVTKNMVSECDLGSVSSPGLPFHYENYLLGYGGFPLQILI